VPILGAHLSIAGGCHKAVERAAVVGCDCVQLFTKNNTQWRARDITAEESSRFRDALGKLAIAHPLAHTSYLINLATPDEVLWRKSIDALAVELRRAEALGIPFVVTHPGCHTTASPEQGVARAVEAIDHVHSETRGLKVKCLVETTAGQGTAVGWRFEQLAEILDGVEDPDRLGICFDTCHVFASGYALRGSREYRATFHRFDSVVGLGQIRAFHLNDSARDRGSRVDRHAHIGRGKIGLAPFRRILTDPRFRPIPMYLETPKESENGVEMDVVNLRVLRRLADGKR